MSIEHLRRTWDNLGRKDPLWAVLSQPDKRHNRWDLQAFFRTGEEEIDGLFRDLERRGLAANRGKCLDFGCGVGRLTQALGGYFDQVDGIDIAQSMVDQARKLNRHGARCRYHLNVRPDLRLFADATFDFVYSNIVLQHMVPEFAEEYIREFVRVLASDGMAVFQVPSRYLGPKPPVASGYLAELRLVAPAAIRRLQPVSQADPTVEGASETGPIGVKFGASRPRSTVLRHLRSLAHQGGHALRPATRLSGPFAVHAVPRARVVILVESAGGDVLAIEDYDVSGPEWENYRYFVRRPAEPATDPAAPPA